MSDELKPGPCRFCGSKDVCTASSGIEIYFTVCEGCGAEGPIAASRAEAIARWNAAGQVVQTAERERCAKIAHEASINSNLCEDNQRLQAQVAELRAALERVKKWSNEYDFLPLALVLAINTALAASEKPSSPEAGG